MSPVIKPQHLFITGGSRSGKSKFAETRAALFGDQVIYLATAEAQDSEMKERIAKHQQGRPAHWITIEAPLKVPEVLGGYQTGYTVLLDCLTMYLSNLYFKFAQTDTREKIPQLILEELADLTTVIANSTANLVVVSNEIGWGIVPENHLARVFRDLAGLANQQIAAVCDQVYLVVSGIPVPIKGVDNVQKP